MQSHNQSIVNMNFYLNILTAAIITVAAVNCTNGDPDVKLYRMDLIINYPINVMNEPGIFKLTDFKDTIPIYTYQEYTVYRLISVRRLSDDSKIPGTHTYFVYRRGDDSGHLFTASMRDSMTLQVDTLLKYRGFITANFSPSAFDSLYEKKDSSGLTVEKYFFKKPAAEFPFDSSYYYLKPKGRLSYSFSRQMDSLRGLEGKKVFKVRLLGNEKFSNEHQAVVPRHELSMEIVEIEEPEPKPILDLIDKYKKSRSSK